jgi:hypothetical protein
MVQHNRVLRAAILLMVQISLTFALFTTQALSREQVSCCGYTVTMSGCGAGSGCWQGSCFCGCGCYDRNGNYTEVNVDCCS